MIVCPNKVGTSTSDRKIANPRWIVKGTQSKCAKLPCCNVCLINMYDPNQSD